MAQVNVLDKKSKVNGSKVIVTKTVEEHLSRQDLFQAKQNLQFQKQGIQQQLDTLTEQLASMEEQDKELDDLLSMLDRENK
ncbi:hypothetical protein [Cytobacillus firmus]|uniref:hypothetical protein n=1 Tax=Cytobacillus firmus TaxID=1399 RepID=UPI0018CE6D23|nr:hypothetical protein [Cytobacillus firmus]MBG9585612.1 hypothetical protein [Cytobacillus firmus]